MKWKRAFSILVFTGLMIGCQTPATPEQSIHPTIQATKSAPRMTDTARPTTTVAPTKVPQTPIPTLDIAATVIATSSPKIYSSFSSTDGEWRAEIVIHDCTKVQGNIDANAVEMLKLIRDSDQTEMIAESLLLTCEGVGAYGIGGLFWSPNSQFFYYTDARESVPDGLCGYWARPIKRVDIDSQEVTSVGGGHFSPDKTKLAFWQENEIVIWSLDEGEIARVPATRPEAFKNEIAWSPDSQSLVYLQTALDCYPFGKSYVTRFDLPGMTQTLLFESEEPAFSWLTWDAPNRISLVDNQGKRWHYNLVSKGLNPVQ